MTGEYSNPRSPASPWRDGWVWTVFALALVLRLFYLSDLVHTPFFEHPQMDALYHDQWAREIAGGDLTGEGVFFRAPLYPYFLGGLYALGLDALGVRVVQMGIGALTALLTAVLAYRRFGRRTAVAAGFLVAVHGPLIYFEGELLLVVLEAPLNLLTAWAVDRALTANTPRRWGIAGVILGLAALARPTILAFVPVLGLYLLGKLRVRAAVPLGVFGGALFLALLPALAHNWVLGHDVVPVASQGGLNYYLGNNPASDGMAALAPEFRQSWEGGVEDAERMAEMAEGRDLKPSEVSDYWMGKALAWAKSHPGDFLLHQAKKLAYFWDSFEIPNNQDYYYFSGLTRLFRWHLVSGFFLLGPLALAGLVIALLRRRLPFAYAAVPLTLMAAIVAFFVCAKFRVSLVPLLAIWASLGFFLTADAFREPGKRRGMVWVAVILAAAALIDSDPWGLRRRHDTAESHLRLGIFYAGLGRLEAAREEYETAVAVRPGFAEGWNNLGVIHAREGDLTAARANFERALAVEPRYPRSLGNLAALAFREGRRAEADSLARVAVQTAGRSPEAMYNAAVVLGNLGDPAAAGAAFRYLVDWQPGHVAARVGLARALVQLGRKDEALRVLRAHPANPLPPEIQAMIKEIQNQ